MSTPYKRQEMWTQDPEGHNLWHGEAGVIVNAAALEERSSYFDIVRVPSQHAAGTPPTPTPRFV